MDRYELDQDGQPVFSHSGLLQSILRVCQDCEEGVPRWAHASRITGLGSTYSIRLCTSLGLDPHEIVRPYTEAESECP